MAAVGINATIYARTCGSRSAAVTTSTGCQKHGGRILFDGTRGWQSSRFGWDYYGYHLCDIDSGIGHQVNVWGCGEDFDPSTGRMQLWYVFAYRLRTARPRVRRVLPQASVKFFHSCP